MWGGLINSFIVAFFVVVISVPVGLGATLLLTRLQFRARDGLYAVLVSPILTPGIILGISTACIFIVLTIAGAAVYEIMRRRERNRK